MSIIVLVLNKKNNNYKYYIKNLDKNIFYMLIEILVLKFVNEIIFIYLFLKF